MQTVIVTIIVAAAVTAAIRYTINIIKNKGNVCAGCHKCDKKQENKTCHSKK